MADSADQSGHPPSPSGSVDRREFLNDILGVCCAGAPLLLGIVRLPAQGTSRAYDPSEHLYGMGLDPQKCIGCARCVVACKAENDVPQEPHYFNTWIERYIIREDGEVEVDSPNGGIDGFGRIENPAQVRRTFFVPKLCNHCDSPPCVQVCPVGATFITEDGVILVDEEYCIGCRYCIQACPYGARYMHPERHVAGKCTFCYHRVVKGKVPACVEVCPTGARIFGELTNRATPLARFRRFNDLQVLKPHLNTRPKMYYANLDAEVS
ncbi:MAG: 4Fe-4S dicluster domain-containing protein [Gemmatimonadota bacterium]|nr:4Fe-4S dicluster domain-containing protein [Gemmatimonadota bacterium]